MNGTLLNMAIVTSRRAVAGLALLLAVGAFQATIAKASGHEDEEERSQAQGAVAGSEPMPYETLYCAPLKSGRPEVLCEITLRVIYKPELEVQIVPASPSAYKAGARRYATRLLPSASSRWPDPVEERRNRFCFAGELSPSQEIDCEGLALGNRFRLSLQLLEGGWIPLGTSNWRTEYWQP